MTDYEKQKVKDFILAMTDEEKEIVKDILFPKNITMYSATDDCWAEYDKNS